ncbi:MAG: ATP-binding cassette domain-containing protein [Syntrophobacteraceae bacterium]
MIAVQDVSKFLGKKELFKGVSFQVNPGERIGLIGPNGTGKTTLFQILLGNTEPDGGMVTRARGVSLGYLPQQWTPVEGKTILAHALDIHEQVHAIHDELKTLQESLDTVTDRSLAAEMAKRQTFLLDQLEHMEGYDLEARAMKILAGLSFRTDRLNEPVTSLSGGWVMRLELARLLLAQPDLLLLDEPTNHLDLDSLLWLEQYLLASSSAMIIVSHDRIFLNRVVRRIFEIEQGVLQEYAGNYDAYLDEKALRREIQMASYNNQQDRIKNIERFIERNRYRKSTARQAQSRLKQMEKIERIEAPVHDAEIHFVFPEPPPSGKRVMELKNVKKAYGEHVVYDGVDFTVEKGDRIAFIGENGAGKSTLLKILAGVESIGGGERAVGPRTAIGYYAQYQWEQLHTDWTILEEASSVAGDMPQSRLRGLLGAFLFQGDDVLKKVVVLSGGEKARLILCKLLLQRPNFLLMDEPTNHLDIPSREVLEKALADFPGTICFISHDRHFINAIANRILTVHAGCVHVFPGNYDDFREIWEKRLMEGESGGAAEAPSGNAAGEAKTRTDQDRKRMRAEWRNELYRLKKPLQERVELAEAALETAHAELDELNGRLEDPDTYRGGDGNRIQTLRVQHHECQERIRRLTEEWEESALALEELEERFWKDRETA